MQKRASSEAESPAGGEDIPSTSCDSKPHYSAGLQNGSPMDPTLSAMSAVPNIASSLRSACGIVLQSTCRTSKQFLPFSFSGYSSVLRSLSFPQCVLRVPPRLSSL